MAMTGLNNGGFNHLSPVLRKTLKQMGHRPARLPEGLLARPETEAVQAVGIDGTERRIQRPLDPEVQEGGKKAHTVKNNLIAGLDDRDIKYLGKTRSGKAHDKRVADEEQAQVPDGYEVYRDSDFQGHQMGDGITLFEPKKKPRGGELTREEKRRNQAILRTRVVVGHVISGVKRCRCVKELFGSWKEDFDDLVMELACGLHNFRNASRVRND